MVSTRPADFALERYFARWEFACRYNLCASGIEGWRMSELLGLADEPTLRLWDELTLGYTDSAGHPLLREEIAKRYPGCAVEHVHGFAGAEEAIAMLVASTVESGDHVVVVRPAYQSLFELARARGAELTEVWLRHEDGYVLDVGRIESALRPNTKLVVVNFPHNPTGTTITASDQARLVAACESRGCWLLSDEVYRGLEHDPAAALPPAVTLSERAISLGALAKVHGLPGLRIGWLVIRDRGLRERVASLRDYGSMCNAGPSEILALVALRREATVLARSRAILETNLPVLERFMTAHADRLAWVHPRGGVIAFPRFVDPNIDSEAFCERLVRETGVLLLPASKYGVKEPAFRIGFGRRDFAEGLAAFGIYLDRR